MAKYEIHCQLSDPFSCVLSTIERDPIACGSIFGHNRQIAWDLLHDPNLVNKPPLRELHKKELL
jgi:hypothetical protein